MLCAILYYLYNLKNVKTPMEERHFQESCRLTLLKVTLLLGCFSRFLNCTNGKKQRNSSLLKIQCSVCNFQSMKSPMELNCLFSKFFCYITWFVISPGSTGSWTTCKRSLYVKQLGGLKITNCAQIAWRFKTYKLCSNKRICCISNAPNTVNPFLTTQAKT